MKGLDSNILLRYFANDDPTQSAKAKRLIESCTRTEPAYISVLAIAECIWTLSKVYKLSDDDLVLVLDTLLGDRRFVLQHEDEVFLATRQLELGFDFADVLILRLGQSAGCTTTYTFDRKAGRLSGFKLL